MSKAIEEVKKHIKSGNLFIPSDNFSWVRKPFLKRPESCIFSYLKDGCIHTRVDKWEQLLLLKERNERWLMIRFQSGQK